MIRRYANLMSMGERELIQEGLDYFGISCAPSVIDSLSFYTLELTRWNRRVNLTGKKGTEPIIRELLYDALFLLSAVQHAATIVDVGSGNGILAVTFACLDRKMLVYSVDKNLKKIQFQRHIKRSLGLVGLQPVHGRIETLDPLNADAAVVKGLGPTAQVLDMVSGHLLKEGRVYLLKGTRDEEIDHPRFMLEKALSYRLPQSPKQYRLLLYKKIS